MEDLFELANWKSQDPDASDGDWYKDFGTFKLCGTGRFPSTFLMSGEGCVLALRPPDQRARCPAGDVGGDGHRTRSNGQTGHQKEGPCPCLRTG